MKPDEYFTDVTLAIGDTKGRLPKKKTGKCGNFEEEKKQGGVYPNPTSIFYCF